MQDGACRKAGAFATAALAVCLGLNRAEAQYDYYLDEAPQAQQGRFQTVSLEEYHDLNRRLQAIEASYAAVAAADGCKELDIQTRPNHNFRGRVFFDHTMVEDTTRVQENFTGFRTARIGVAGNIYENLAYTFEVEFEGEDTDFKDISAEFRNLPWVSTLKFGHFKEPFGLEQLTSSRYTTMMERSMPTGSFTPSRKFGFQLGGDIRDNENLSAWVGMFRNRSTDSPASATGLGGFNDDSNDLTVTGRLAFLPFYDEPSDGRYLLHTGIAASARRMGGTAGGGARGRFRPTLELANHRENDATLNADSEFNLFGTELAWVNGPLSVQNEFFWIDSNDGAFVWGTYVQVSYFLTGESRGYSRRNKVFDRVRPFEPFFAVRTANGVCRGWGAWELTARYSYMDATDAALQGDLSEHENIALGVNWYLNPYSRAMFNYVHSVNRPVGGATVEGDHLGLRFQFDW